MGRRGNKGQRDTTVIPSDPLLPELSFQAPSPFVDPLEGLNSLLDVQDLRTFSPEAPFTEPRSFSGVSALVGDALAQPRRKSSRSLGAIWRTSLSTPFGVGPSKLSFTKPDETVVCARRKERREVLFARGRGGRNRKRRRRNENSNIRC